MNCTSQYLSGQFLNGQGLHFGGRGAIVAFVSLGHLQYSIWWTGWTTIHCPSVLLEGANGRSALCLAGLVALDLRLGPGMTVRGLFFLESSNPGLAEHSDGGWGGGAGSGQWQQCAILLLLETDLLS